ncbi:MULTISPECIES: hypothetical protein [Acinetobacter]|uniref:hypothetical protein n=1 Tax=Acinetobacter TaxID=469 RepID=UPI0013EEB0B4|nr:MULTISPECIES: hypothetical protein [Acinetobacter]
MKKTLSQIVAERRAQLFKDSHLCSHDSYVQSVKVDFVAVLERSLKKSKVAA